MMDERELRDFHGRLVKALAWSVKNGASRAQVRELAQLRIVLDWMLEIGTKTATDWSAGIFRQLSNLEALRRQYEQSERESTQ